MTAIFRRLGAIDSVVGEFILVLARFEYALKAAGFVTGDEHDARADWLGFARSISKVFDKNLTSDLREACYYILSRVPRKQVVVDDHLTWKYSPPDISYSEIEKILLTISRIRENLLHGGTFAHGHYEEVGDDERLLQNSLVVLDQCLSLDNQIESNFDR